MQPSLTHWIEEALKAMPPRGRLTLKAPHELAFGFTDDRKTPKGNQDRLALAYCLDHSNFGESWFFAGICDGVGGEAQGDVAASIAMAEILSEICTSCSNTGSTRLSDAIYRAHRSVRERLPNSATTFAGIFLTASGKCTIGTAGDSRIYSVAKSKVLQLSLDDTLEDMLLRRAKDSDNNRINEALKGLNQVWKESLGQAVGSDLPIEPRIQEWNATSSDVGCLLCTDGVWKTVEPVLERTVTASGNRFDLARRLLSLTESLAATDNATAIVLPELTLAVDWLQNNHSSVENGLVHIVLPTESVVTPWRLLKKIEPGILPVHKLKAKAEAEAKTKPKSKLKRKPKTAKPSTKEKDQAVQLSIVEEISNEFAATTGSLSDQPQSTS